MSEKTLYDQLAEKLAAIDAAYQDVAKFADEHKLVVSYRNRGPANIYIPNAKLDEIEKIGERDWNYVTYIDFMHNFYESSAEISHDNEWRGTWITSSHYCP